MSLLIKHTCQHRNQQGYVKTHTAPETLGSCEEQQGFLFFFFFFNVNAHIPFNMHCQ